MDWGEEKKRTLLKQAELIFGKPVTWQDSFAEIESGLMLSWLAQAHEAWCSRKIDRPWGLVYHALRGELRQKQPDKRFLIDPLPYLPREFLEACGLAYYLCHQCGLEFHQLDDFEAHQKSAHPAQQPPEETELPEEEPEEQDFSQLPPEQARIAKAWAAVLRMLEPEMPRGPFETWLRGTRALDWDDDSGLLRISARDPAAAEWLQSRISSRAGRWLCGIMNREVQVRFVSAIGSHAPEEAPHTTKLDERKEELPLHLSENQLRVVRGVARGKTRRLIAQEMGITIRTVASHLTRAYERLGAVNAPEAISLAIEKGLDV